METNRKPPNYQSRQKHKDKGTVVIQNNEKTKDTMAVVSPYISVITLSVNGLNSPVKRQTAGQIKKKT